MKTLVIYDITDDDIRNKVAEICKNYGLKRIQKSAFIGNLTSTKRKELKAELEKTLGNKKGNIQIYTLCRHCYAERISIGQPTIPEEYKEEIIVI